jgi:cell division protein FtsQ
MRKDGTRRNIKAFILSKQFFIALMAFMSLLALICLALVFSRFIGVGEFEIKGETDYRLSELISKSGIRTGDMMSSVNERKAEKILLEKCPYLKSVEVKKKFPNKICFEVEERVLGWYLEVSDDYYALDYDLLVLLETYDEESLKERGLTRLVLPEIESAICDRLPEFGHGDEQLIRETLKIIDSFRTSGIKERLTYLDLSNRFEIKLTIDGEFDVKLGDMKDIETKLATVTETIEKALASGFVGGEINMITPTTCSFKGEFPAPEEPEEPTDSEKSPEEEE